MRSRRLPFANTWVRAVGFVFVLALVNARSTPAPATGLRLSTPTKPNIVLFLVDDMGWQDTSLPFYTHRTPLNERYHTPNMVKLAAQGMKFTAAYANCVCTPSRVSLLTGLDAARHRVTNWTYWKDTPTDGDSPDLILPRWNVNGLSDSHITPHSVCVQTLPEVLHKNGYRTIIVGKGHFGAYGTPGSQPYHLGFDVSIASHGAGQPGSYLPSDLYGLKKGDIHTVPDLDLYYGSDTFLTEALTREADYAVDRSVADRKPFFLYLAHYAVHLPYAADSRYYQKYRDEGLSDVEAKYAALLEGMDASLGEVMAHIDRLGLSKNTIFLFMSDNGGLAASDRTPPLNVQNAPLRSGKGSAYEGGVREPMIVKWPGVTTPGSVCNTPVIINDFFSTIAAMAGVAPGRTPRSDGFSFIPLLKGISGYPKGRAIIWHYPNVWGAHAPGVEPYSAIRQGVWKLIYFHPEQRFELYDISEDIGELQNLAERQPAIGKRLAHLLQKRLVAEAAQMPTVKATGRKVPWPGDAWDMQQRLGLSHIKRAPGFRPGAVDHVPFAVWGAAMPDN